MGTPDAATTEHLLAAVDAARDRLVDLARDLVRIPTENPPSDTRAVVAAIHAWLRDVPGARAWTVTAQPPVDNLVAVAAGASPGRRLIFNGHLDTYPAGDRGRWRHGPFSGAVEDGRLYGRGSGDMKGGVAASLTAFEVLARNPDRWAGEVVMTLAGDEESMGPYGTRHLVATVPEAVGDAVICGDVGSPRVVRVGEKGYVWLDVVASGRAAHGAHVHRGVNAIDRLREAMDALAALRSHPVDTPPAVERVIEAAAPVSEPLAGAGESRVMREVTVNFGRIEGGVTANLVADHAEVHADIRLPLGVTTAEVVAEIERRLGAIEGVEARVRRRQEPTWTDPGDAVVAAVSGAVETVLGLAPVVNMRIGASDSGVYRDAGVPTVVCGLTTENLGGADENVALDELLALAKIHTLAAARYLRAH